VRAWRTKERKRSQLSSRRDETRKREANLVVDLDVGNSNDGVLELVVLVGIGGSLHHGESSVVELV